MISGGVGVVGVVGTAVTAWAGSRSQFRTQAMLAADGRARQIEDIRRTGCAEFLAAADTFADQARELAARMLRNAERGKIEEANDAYEAGWKLLKRVYAPVAIAGPECLGKAAQAYMAALADIARECDGWRDAYVPGPSVPDWEPELGKLRRKADKARDAFILQARQETYAEEKPTVSAAPTRRLGAVRAVAGLWQRRKAVGD